MTLVKIAYIELDTHAEIAGNFMQLMQASKDFSVDYYFSQKIIKQIGQNDSTIFLSESTDLLNQLSGQNYDLVIIGTVHRYFNLFKDVAQQFNSSVIVHNFNFTKISRYQLFKNIFKKDFKYRLKLYWKEDLLSAPQVFQKASNLLVLDQSLVQNRLKYLPVFFNQSQVHHLDENFIIVIPGTVSQQRRDYKKVLQDLTDFQFGQNVLDRLLKIVFLGKADGKELQWLQDFDSKKGEKFSIKYFTEKVSQPIFDEWMNKADVLWCPIRSETEFFSHPEVYGKTKMSGNIGDAIKYGKMAFFPEDYPSDFDFILNEKMSFKAEIFDCKQLDNYYDFQQRFGKKIILANLEKVLKSLI